MLGQRVKSEVSFHGGAEDRSPRALPVNYESMAMLPSIFESCVPRPDVKAGTTKDEQFAADLAQVIRGTAPDEYRVPAVFFRNSYPTRGMKELLKAVCQRLSGHGGEIGSVFRLDTQYGDGKTHGLIALVHAVKGMLGVGERRRVHRPGAPAPGQYGVHSSERAKLYAKACSISTSRFSRS